MPKNDQSIPAEDSIEISGRMQTSIRYIQQLYLWVSNADRRVFDDHRIVLRGLLRSSDRLHNIFLQPKENDGNIPYTYCTTNNKQENLGKNGGK